MMDTMVAVEREIRAIPDPEIPVISIDDLGIVRAVATNVPLDGVVTVTITPTYSGCPAIQAIADDIARVADRYGLRARVQTQLDPAWTTDWMSPAGREALRRFGIAPPGRREDHRSGAVPVGLSRRLVACPQCGSDQTEELSRFGSTACKALRRCRSCAEPFEEFKAI